jgi:signal transduction histidine kinase
MGRSQSRRPPLHGCETGDMVSTDVLSPDEYASVLSDYVRNLGEQALYRASLLSRGLVQSGLGPEDIVALHMETLDRITGDMQPFEQVRAINNAHQFLLEVMIAYGVHYKEYLELRLEDSLREANSRLVQVQERSREIERIGREKDEILGMIAHELRSPITAVKTHLELIELSLARGQLERVPALIPAAREAIERLSRLTGDLVEASRDQPPELEFRAEDLGRVLSQACAWARPAAQAKGIALHYDQEGESLLVHGNADALLSVFGNLLSNAIRYTPPGGTVRIRQGTDGGERCIEVRDTGFGMTPETKARLFEKFYRSPEARRAEPRGLGLGLALVQQFVNAHKGRVEVESTPGQGSVFRVVLPSARPSV